MLHSMCLLQIRFLHIHFQLFYISCSTYKKYKHKHWPGQFIFSFFFERPAVPTLGLIQCNCRCYHQNSKDRTEATKHLV
uniref:Secreted protein n=1 Tax=Octopus bimaculoides TaxID=37653 RepID=A0A0L8FUP2_OCTBM